jgi:hypothetical protein
MREGKVFAKFQSMLAIYRHVVQQMLVCVDRQKRPEAVPDIVCIMILHDPKATRSVILVDGEVSKVSRLVRSLLPLL